jgi:hypothetical protein
LLGSSPQHLALINTLLETLLPHHLGAEMKVCVLRNCHVDISYTCAASKHGWSASKSAQHVADPSYLSKLLRQTVGQHGLELARTMPEQQIKGNKDSQLQISNRDAMRRLDELRVVSHVCSISAL